MFTYENLRQYAVLKAMGAMHNTLLKMILVQAGVCALLGTGLGLGSCVVIGELVSRLDYPFRMMWFTPIVGVIGVMIVSLTAAVISLRPVIKLQPAVVFSGR
jgi:putative ABC transport system permease protein